MQAAINELNHAIVRAERRKEEAQGQIRENLEQNTNLRRRVEQADAEITTLTAAIVALKEAKP